MGQILHGSAKTTYAIRAELQRSQASVAQLAKKYGINEKTVLKWCQRHCKNPRKWQSKIPHSRFWRSGGWWRASIFGWAPAAAWFDECGRSNWRVCPDVLRQEIGMATQAIA